MRLATNLSLCTLAVLAMGFAAAHLRQLDESREPAGDDAAAASSMAYSAVAGVANPAADPARNVIEVAGVVRREPSDAAPGGEQWVLEAGEEASIPLSVRSTDLELDDYLGVPVEIRGTVASGTRGLELVVLSAHPTSRYPRSLESDANPM